MRLYVKEDNKGQWHVVVLALLFLFVTLNPSVTMRSQSRDEMDLFKRLLSSAQAC